MVAKVRGLLAALVLTVLTLGPAVDGLLCRCDWDGGGEAATAAAAQAQPDEPCDGAAGEAPCLHCFCHHTTPFAGTLAAEAPTRTGFVTRHRLAQSTPPPSDLVLGLKRPPRA